MEPMGTYEACRTSHSKRRVIQPPVSHYLVDYGLGYSAVLSLGYGVLQGIHNGSTGCSRLCYH